MHRIRWIQLSTAATFALALSGCDIGRTDILEKQVAELQSQVSELAGHLDGVNSALDDAETELASLKDALDELYSSVEEVGNKYRRIDLHEVQGAMADVEIATTKVESHVTDARQATGR